MSENQETSANNLPSLPLIRLQDKSAPELPALAAGLVHEVKNPLAAIHLHLQLLQNYINEVNDADLRGKLQDKVSFIKSQILGLNSILHEFLAAIRASYPEKSESGLSEIISADHISDYENTADHTEENHHSEINRHPDLNHLTGEIVSLLEPQAASADVMIRFIPDEKVDSESQYYNWDTAFVKQIAVNLIINAIQAHQSEKNSNKDKYVIIATGLRSDNRLFFSVKDNGPGISHDAMEKLFDPFYTTKESGSGLGLALVKKMISEMKGIVEVHSDPGKGSEFTVVFGNRKSEKEVHE